MSSAAIFGSTGLVGSHILSTLLASESAFATVHTVSRRAPKSEGPKLHAIVEPDTSQWVSKLTSISPAPTTVFSALGTTRAQAGGIAAQWKIDHDLNVELARAAREAGSRAFVFVSSAGTGGLSGMAPYSKMKRGVEEAVEAAGFEHAVVLRPGLIIGDREVPHQGGPLLNGVVRGLGRWCGQWAQDKIGQDAEVIARAAVHAARIAEEGKAPSKYWVLEQADIVRLGRTEWKD
ncbi:protein FMP52, mitochondrial [Phialemonium atrogriseum]|uniref:Protein FMP52, mitochondrial n=1 Tax=Phialemonium atrogriseum TaxID=1093897 RepID=A0AAJ0CCH9_9PEZI|nr:protein FMP52, mitochondrial [Phialemonium atrogriseum]KAK1771771.1 protein FMP52, mitochondrial [Phialemonium atrogriseum]